MQGGRGEVPFVFECRGDSLCAVLHEGDSARRHGLLIVVGGPQYRVGSHRQFVLLARALAAAGIPVLRFDYRGMGDSGGAPRSFEAIDEDIAAAVDAFVARAGVSRVALWGLCDGASAAAFYAPTDPRVAGLVLLNPWVRTEAGEARAYLKNYYVDRLLSRALWADLVRGRIDVAAALRSFLQMVTRSRRRGAGGDASGAPAAEDLPTRLRRSLAAFEGAALFVISGRDLTGQEFVDAATGREWEALLAAPRFTRHDVPEADHTFSSAAWRDDVAAATLDWLRELAGDG